MKKEKTIIIVDDDKFLLDMYAVKFSQNGFKVETFQNGELVLEKLRNGTDAVAILLDIIMPGMTGIELLELMGKEDLKKGMSVIVLSNQGEDSDVQKAKDLGADGYIIKASTIPSEVLEQTITIIDKK